MSRLGKGVLVAFIVLGCLIFASALAGGLMDDSAFTPEAKGAAH